LIEKFANVSLPDLTPFSALTPFSEGIRLRYRDVVCRKVL
jgi:hypothetical protein